jgi:hypothetical protein
MVSLFSPDLIAPVVVALISAASTYLIIIKQTRTELTTQTKSALHAFREKTEAADINDRLVFRAEQKAELYELRKQLKESDVNKADMVLKLATAQASIMILEARVRVLEQEPR